MGKDYRKEYTKVRKPKPYNRKKVRQDTIQVVDNLRTNRKVVTR